MSGISGETLAIWTFALQILSTILIPVMVGMLRYLWKLDRRLYVLEVKAGVHRRETD